jgi:tetratricopeptide (TPR) repeat protein
VTAADTGPATDAADARWHLADREEFLERSLADAEREHAAGDLTDADYELLERRDRAKLAEVRAALAALGPAGAPTAAGNGSGPGEGRPARRPRAPQPPPADRGRRRRAWLGIAGLAVLVAGAVVLVADLTTSRLPGQPATGSIKLSAQELVTEQLTQATTLAEDGQSTAAIELYGRVLTEDPGQPQALAEDGWLTWQKGVTAKSRALTRAGAALVGRAVKVDPAFGAAHLYLGTIDLLQESNAEAAAVQYRLFLAGHPTPATVQSAAPDIRRAFAEIGQAVPAGVPATG